MRSFLHLALGMTFMLLATELVQGQALFDWIPATEAERAAVTSNIDPGAGAEILYYIKEIDASSGATRTNAYMRVKIFDEKGVEQFGKADIYYDRDDDWIKRLEARVIKPDGTIINVGKEAFYDRDIVRINKARMRVRSFAFPGLAPGDIAEYRWHSQSSYYLSEYKFYLMHDVPARHVLFRIRPSEAHIGWITDAYFFRAKGQMIQKDKGDFYYVERRDVPQFVAEPCMPPAGDCQPWVVYYARNESLSAESFWEKQALNASDFAEHEAKRPGKLVRATAREITRNAGTTVERLKAINDYCRGEILNIYQYTPAGGVSQKILSKGNRTPAELIVSKQGRPHEIQALFVALARAVGIDARLMYCADRDAGAFKRELLLWSQLPNKMVAVKIEGEWKFYYPALRLLDTGRQHWRTENSPAVIVLKKGIEWITIPKGSVSDAIMKRTGVFRLDENGTLTGEVRLDYQGHHATQARAYFYLESDEKIKKWVEDYTENLHPLAEVTDVRVPNANDCLRPLSVMWHVRIPNYAEHTGQRLLLRPGFFTRGEDAVFTSDTRTHDIWFNFAETVEDDIQITVPENYKVEEGSSPVSTETLNWGKFTVNVALRRSTNTILYKRKFEFSLVHLPASSYQSIKRVFDFVRTQDAHTLVLRKTD